MAAIVLVGQSHATVVAYYTFDEGAGTMAADTASIYNAGDTAQDATTNQGTVGWTSGVVGGAVDLPGNASMQIADPFPAGTMAFTISLWVNMDDTPGYDGIFESRPENWGINVEGGSAENLHIDYRYDNPPVGSGGSMGIDSAGGSIVVGTWHNVLMTWDGANGTGDMYLDGNLISSATGLTTTYVSTGWNIGDDPCCGGRELNAQLDDIAVWDEVLSPAQIQAIYADGISADSVGAPAAVNAVPEPATGLLLIVTSLGLLRFRR
ncbi:MAG: LamG domain-containing protein [Planctomycetota bacterium]